MKIKYLGPRKSVNVAGWGPHFKNETKEYPDDFGRELLASSRKQKFEQAGGADSKVETEPAAEKKTGKK